MLTHLIKPTENFSIVTKAYKTNFRNWYKLDALKLGSSKVSINNILTNPAYCSTMPKQQRHDVLVKNNRKYEAKGIQSGKLQLETGKAKHDIDFGIRYHEDYEDRFQWIDGYAQNGVMNRTSNGTRNRCQFQL
jgi:Fe(3+) dicitrate transport protein